MEGLGAEEIQFGDIDFSSPTILSSKAPYKMRRTFIMVTLSNPMISDVEIQQLMEVGINILRFNMAKISERDKINMLGKIENAATNYALKVGIPNWPGSKCVDLKTCIVRTGLLEQEAASIPIAEGTNVILTNNIQDFETCTEKKIFVDNAYLSTEAKEGMEISIGQDEVVLICTAIINKQSIECVVKKGGELGNLAYVSMKGLQHKKPLLIKRDYEIIEFALRHQIEMIIVNYVRKAETLKMVKKYIGNRKKPLIVSGLCTQECLDNIDEIAKESDIILLPRQFLPYELDKSQQFKLCKIQKWVGAKCRALGKPLFISGDVFENFQNGVYSNVEIVDITNSLLDGASGFILKHCEDVDNTLEAVNILQDLCKSVEPYTNSKTNFWRMIDEVKIPLNAAEASMIACAAAANRTEARAIIIPTVTGSTVRALQRMMPACLVIAVCRETSVARMLHACRCVVPLLYTEPQKGEWVDSVEAKVKYAVEFAVKRSWLHYGFKYVTLQRGSENSTFCDTVRIWNVTISKKALVECSDDTDVLF